MGDIELDSLLDVTLGPHRQKKYASPQIGMNNAMQVMDVFISENPGYKDLNTSLAKIKKSPDLRELDQGIAFCVTNNNKNNIIRMQKDAGGNIKIHIVGADAIDEYIIPQDKVNAEYLKTFVDELFKKPDLSIKKMLGLVDAKHVETLHAKEIIGDQPDQEQVIRHYLRVDQTKLRDGDAYSRYRFDLKKWAVQKEIKQFDGDITHAALIEHSIMNLYRWVEKQKVPTAEKDKILEGINPLLNEYKKKKENFAENAKKTVIATKLVVGDEQIKTPQYTSSNENAIKRENSENRAINNKTLELTANPVDVLLKISGKIDFDQVTIEHFLQNYPLSEWTKNIDQKNAKLVIDQLTKLIANYHKDLFNNKSRSASSLVTLLVLSTIMDNAAVKLGYNVEESRGYTSRIIDNINSKLLFCSKQSFELVQACKESINNPATVTNNSDNSYNKKCYFLNSLCENQIISEVARDLIYQTSGQPTGPGRNDPYLANKMFSTESNYNEVLLGKKNEKNTHDIQTRFRNAIEKSKSEKEKAMLIHSRELCHIAVADPREIKPLLLYLQYHMDALQHPEIQGIVMTQLFGQPTVLIDKIKENPELLDAILNMIEKGIEDMKEFPFNPETQNTDHRVVIFQNSNMLHRFVVDIRDPQMLHRFGEIQHFMQGLELKNADKIPVIKTPLVLAQMIDVLQEIKKSAQISSEQLIRFLQYQQHLQAFPAKDDNSKVYEADIQTLIYENRFKIAEGMKNNIKNDEVGRLLGVGKITGKIEFGFPEMSVSGTNGIVIVNLQTGAREMNNVALAAAQKANELAPGKCFADDVYISATVQNSKYDWGNMPAGRANVYKFQLNNQDYEIIRFTASNSEGKKDTDYINIEVYKTIDGEKYFYTGKGDDYLPVGIGANCHVWVSKNNIRVERGTPPEVVFKGDSKNGFTDTSGRKLTKLPKEPSDPMIKLLLSIDKLNNIAVYTDQNNNKEIELTGVHLKLQVDVNNLKYVDWVVVAEDPPIQGYKNALILEDNNKQKYMVVPYPDRKHYFKFKVDMSDRSVHALNGAMTNTEKLVLVYIYMQQGDVERAMTLLKNTHVINKADEVELLKKIIQFNPADSEGAKNQRMAVNALQSLACSQIIEMIHSQQALTGDPKFVVPMQQYIRDRFNRDAEPIVRDMMIYNRRAKNLPAVLQLSDTEHISLMNYITRGSRTTDELQLTYQNLLKQKDAAVDLEVIKEIEQELRAIESENITPVTDAEKIADIANNPKDIKDLIENLNSSISITELGTQWLMSANFNDADLLVKIKRLTDLFSGKELADKLGRLIKILSADLAGMSATEKTKHYKTIAKCIELHHKTTGSNQDLKTYAFECLGEKPQDNVLMKSKLVITQVKSQILKINQINPGKLYSFPTDKSKASIDSFINQYKKPTEDELNNLLLDVNSKIRIEQKEGGLKRDLTLADLRRLFLQSDSAEYQRLTGINDINEIQKLHERIGYFIWNDSELQRANRLIALYEEAKNNPDDKAIEKRLQQEIASSRSYGLTDHPLYIVFEHLENKSIRAEQKRMLDKLVNNADPQAQANTNYILQMIMGGGKSKVLLPIFAMLNSRADQLAVLIVPKELLQTNIQDLELTIRQCTGQGFYQFVFDRYTDTSPNAMRNMKQLLLEKRRNKEYIVCSAEDLQSLELKYFELLDTWNQPLGETERSELLTTLRDLKSIVKLFKGSTAIIDEVDLVLQRKKELNYAVGAEVKVNKAYTNYSIDLFKQLSACTIKIAEENISFNDILSGKVAPPANKGQWKSIYQQLKLKLPANSPDGILNFVFPDLGEVPKDTMDWLINNPAAHQELSIYKHILNDVLPYTLNAIYKKDYGKTDDSAKPFDQKNIALPYAGMNKPKETSRFGDEYETLAYTTQMILREPLTYQLCDAFVRSILSTGTNDIANQQLKELFKEEAPTIDAIRQNKNLIFEKFKDNQNLKFYVLKEQILPNIKRDQKMQRSNGQTLAGMTKRVQGVSGTTDNYRSFNKRFIPPEAGADDETLNKIFENTTGITIFPNLQSPNTEVIVNALLANKSENTRAIIDAGAQFKCANFEVATILATHPPNKNLKYILYYDQNENLCALNVSATPKSRILSDTTNIHKTLGCNPSQCFTYYDALHITGSDIKQMSNASAVVTVDRITNSRDLLQGCMRLRELKNEQRCEMVLMPELISQNPHLKSLSLQEKKDEVKKIAKEKRQNEVKEDTYYGAIQQMEEAIHARACQLIFEICDTPEQEAIVLQAFNDSFFTKSDDDPRKLYGQMSKNISAKDSLDNIKKHLLIRWDNAINNLQLQNLKEAAAKNPLSLADELKNIVDTAAPHCPKEVLAMSGAAQSPHAETQTQKQTQSQTQMQNEKKVKETEYIEATAVNSVIKTLNRDLGQVGFRLEATSLINPKSNIFISNDVKNISTMKNDTKGFNDQNFHLTRPYYLCIQDQNNKDSNFSMMMITEKEKQKYLQELPSNPHVWIVDSFESVVGGNPPQIKSTQYYQCMCECHVMNSNAAYLQDMAMQSPGHREALIKEFSADQRKKLSDKANANNELPLKVMINLDAAIKAPMKQQSAYVSTVGVAPTKVSSPQTATSSIAPKVGTQNFNADKFKTALIEFLDGLKTGLFSSEGKGSRLETALKDPQGLKLLKGKDLLIPCYELIKLMEQIPVDPKEFTTYLANIEEKWANINQQLTQQNFNKQVEKQPDLGTNMLQLRKQKEQLEKQLKPGKMESVAPVPIQHTRKID